MTNLIGTDLVNSYLNLFDLSNKAGSYFPVASTQVSANSRIARFEFLDKTGLPFSRTGTIYEAYRYQVLLSLANYSHVLGTIVVVPIAAILNGGHWVGRKISQYSQTFECTKKAIEIWNDSSLFGDCLTSAPSQCYQFTVHPLTWHLRPDNTDRRADRKYNTASGDVRVIPGEYKYVPFNLFEICTRWGIGGACTVAAGIASPVGLICKTVHHLFKT